LASQRDDCNRTRKPGKGCPNCGKLGQKFDKYYALHGRPP